ncbi:Protein of unknown function DUF343 domain containing protein [Aphelenchoides bicaudatus]|nr:Protein of unknown function DUF343 domain containing protein [Aphelenchoides bicaudatus]
MKLLTHNFLSSQFLRNVKEGYPLILRATKVEQKDVSFNEEQISKLVPKINYPVLVQAAESVGVDVKEYPKDLPSEWQSNTPFLKQVCDLAMSVDVVDGELECPETGRKFIIREGIPNMLVNDDEGQPMED